MTFFTGAGSSVRVYKLLEFRLCDLQWNTVSIFFYLFDSEVFIFVFNSCLFAFVFVLLDHDRAGFV